MAFTDFFTFNFNNAVEQTRQIPVTTVPVGITVLQAALTRGSLDPAIQLSWALDVSRDGGATWLPWGAAGTVGGTVLNKDGSVATESYYTVWLESPADAQTQIRGTLTNTNARMTTRITIRGDTTPIQARRSAPEHHSVLFDNIKDVNGGSVTTLTTASFTITSASQRFAALALVGFGTGPASVTSTCGTVSGALVTNTSVSNGLYSLIHGVTNPASGTQTASMSWTNASGAALGVMTASSVDQTTPTRNGGTTAFSGTTATITVATSVGNLTFACGSPGTNFTSPTQTQVFQDSVNTGGGASRGPGTGTSDIHSWSMASGNYVMSGCDIVAAPSAPTFDFNATNFPKFILQPATGWQENR